MIVLGIDPGTNCTGYGIIEYHNKAYRHIDNGGLRPHKTSTLALKLREIHDGLANLIDKHKPDSVVIESLFVAKNARSSLLLGHARGVAVLAASMADVPISEYSPAEVKQAIVGSGRADKNQIQQMVKAILHLPEIAMEDASDALAAAICHCNSLGLKEKIEKAVIRRS